jgi:hypothetical protein
MLVGIGYVSYWTIPPFRVYVEGDPFLSYDSEIGYVARPNSSAKWTVFATDGKISRQYHVHTDRRGARVANRGEQTPDHVDIVIVGDSFAWGHGVDGYDTFAYKVMSTLGGSGANLALAGYGTTHALQMLRRNRDMAPKLVVFPIIRDHLWRNVSACARSYYPFCLDYSHIAWDAKEQPYVAAPGSDGVARVALQIQAERGRLNPMTWILHGLDVIVARLRFRAANAIAVNTAKQNAALEFLIQQMASTATDMKATLLIVYLPDESMSPPPEVFSRSAGPHGYRFLDLSETFLKLGAAARAQLYLPNDGHPSPAGHTFIAQQLIAFIRREQLLPP